MGQQSDPTRCLVPAQEDQVVCKNLCKHIIKLHFVVAQIKLLVYWFLSLAMWFQVGIQKEMEETFQDVESSKYKTKATVAEM